jgi:hypothetical protein
MGSEKFSSSAKSRYAEGTIRGGIVSLQMRNHSEILPKLTARLPFR